jgi:hypothetical protein
MRAAGFIGGLCLVALLAAAPAGETFKSGLQKGDLLPASFAPFNINGPRQGRYHCLVCEYGLDPVVLVFVREPAKGKEPAKDDGEAKSDAVGELLKKLDDAVARHDKASLHAFAVFLSPDARSSITDPKEDDPGKLVDEANARRALDARLTARAENLKNVVLTHALPDGPKGYLINPKAEVTIVFYQRLKVLANFAFKEGEVRSENIDAVLKTVDETLSPRKKKPARPAKSAARAS